VAGLALAVLMAAAAGAAEHPGDHRNHAATANRPTGSEAVGSLSIPDVPLLNQEGEEVRFYSDLVRGRMVAINFIFTTCTTICPPMGANFARLQRILEGQTGANVHLISVSVDPAVDTPERLKTWAAKFGALPGWTLVTGAKPEVDKLLKALKVFTPDKTDHSPIVLVGDDARGEWTRVWGLAPPADLARTIERMAGAPGAAPNEESGNRK
jgi:protein SCO1/2